MNPKDYQITKSGLWISNFLLDDDALPDEAYGVAITLNYLKGGEADWPQTEEQVLKCIKDYGGLEKALELGFIKLRE